MYSSFQLATKFLNYYLTASNGKGHGMHSPFVFDFTLNVLNNKSGYHPPQKIEALRAELLKDTSVLHVDDLGAGSRVNSEKERTVSQIARTSLKPRKYAQLLYRLAAHYKPSVIVELGTSLGITTSYLASANPAAEVITIEGSTEIGNKATEHFAKLGIRNIRPVNGAFDEELPRILYPLHSVDLAYVDGNHAYEPTIAYFEQLIAKSHNDTILIFDDIHWSAEMEKAWSFIRQNAAVRCTVDIFFLGFVFFRKEFKEKRDFRIRF